MSEKKSILDKLQSQFQAASKEMTGYPVSLLFNYSGLFRFLKFHVNNIGDPFGSHGNYRIHSLPIEKEVLDYMARLVHARKGSYWGYVTNGGTEGNLYGLFIARELHPNGIVFYSDQAHYSIPKNLRLLRMETIKIASQSCGEIDYEALREALIVHRGEKVPIILANIGTTMKGAVDDVLRIKQILASLKIKRYYIHCDAAFFGLILPFLPTLEKQTFDFAAGVDSIAISGHKMLGAPFPCGIVLTKKKHVNQVSSHYIEYTDSKDNTITGSRNGIAALFLWYRLIYEGDKKFRRSVENSIKKAKYAIKRFKERNIQAWGHENSPIVVFPKPSAELVRKWQLAVQGSIAHMITLPHVSYKTIDQVVEQIAMDTQRTR